LVEEVVLDGFAVESAGDLEEDHHLGHVGPVELGEHVVADTAGAGVLEIPVPPLGDAVEGALFVPVGGGAGAIDD
jgi:hypothetical protein